MESVQRSQKSCSLCENAVYSTVETYATHLKSADHVDKLKAIKNDEEILSQRFKCSLFIKRESYRFIIMYLQYNIYFILSYRNERYSMLPCINIIFYEYILGEKRTSLNLGQL